MIHNLTKRIIVKGYVYILFRLCIMPSIFLKDYITTVSSETWVASAVDLTTPAGAVLGFKGAPLDVAPLRSFVHCYHIEIYLSYVAEDLQDLRL